MKKVTVFALKGFLFKTYSKRMLSQRKNYEIQNCSPTGVGKQAGNYKIVLYLQVTQTRWMERRRKKKKTEHSKELIFPFELLWLKRVETKKLAEQEYKAYWRDQETVQGWGNTKKLYKMPDRPNLSLWTYKMISKNDCSVFHKMYGNKFTREVYCFVGPLSSGRYWSIDSVVNYTKYSAIGKTIFRMQLNLSFHGLKVTWEIRWWKIYHFYWSLTLVFPNFPTFISELL